MTEKQIKLIIQAIKKAAEKANLGLTQQEAEELALNLTKPEKEQTQ